MVNSEGAQELPYKTLLDGKPNMDKKDTAQMTSSQRTLVLPERPHLELNDQQLASLREALGKKLLQLLRLPAELEQDFRADYRSKATALMRSSVYGLIGLYLLVVLPVALLVDAPMQATWRNFAVYPIGIALLVIWLATRFWRSQTENALCFGTFLSLLGPTYGFMVLGDSLLGLVAGCETIYVMMVVFSMLMLRIQDVLVCAVCAFVLAASAAFATAISFSWVHSFLYFWVPLVICAITGLVLEYVARRNYVQAMLHQQDRIRVVNYLASLISDEDDLKRVLTLALARVCQHNGWPLGRVTALDSADLAAPVSFARDQAHASQLQAAAHLWSQPDSPLLAQLCSKGEACWLDCTPQLGKTLSPPLPLRRHLLFPIKLDNRVLAVLELYCTQEILPDQRLFALMDNVSLQLGRVFEHARQKRELRHKAMHDSLTGLPNRAYLFEHMEREMARSKRYTDSSFCVLFVDADHFKWVNDSLGHLAGDKLLVDLAARLRRCVRTEDFVARLGGDEFAIVIRVANDDDRIARTIECIRSRLLLPFELQHQEVLLGLSVGVVKYDSHYSEAEELLRDADTAMYAAKKKGRGRFEVFNLDMHAQVVGRLKLLAELRQALEQDQFVLHYQPVVDASQGYILGFEALLRWQHPERGLLSPDQFIPLAEETGLIIQLSHWVISRACLQLREWQLQAGGRGVSISVNLCASYLAQPDLPERLLAFAKDSNIDVTGLHLEITETQVVANAELCMVNIKRLRDLGFSIYIDDFGTGYSSLSYLADFRVNALKIDKVFIDKLCEGGKDAHIVQIIVELGHQLNLSVIAEGVETYEQLQRLQDMGCDSVQGYFYSRPVGAGIASDMLNQQLHSNSGFYRHSTVAG